AFAVHFARYGLSWPKFNALVQLYLAGGGLIQAELSTKVLVSSANVTGLIERLEKDDLVFREDDPSDRRVLRVYLTDKARWLMEYFLPIHTAFIGKVMSAPSNQEKEILTELLGKLKAGLESD
ncbi:MAG: MarR family transcriptional regulator, partial [Peptococcaceae bacterium]|nr:MarR family transcriptional regulator [Peptococcaceae bacterium]